MKKKAIVIAEFPAPYRVGVFDELAREYTLTVFFDAKNEVTRDKDYSIKNIDFPHFFLNTKEGKRMFWKEMKHIKKYDFSLIYNFCIKYGVIAFTISKFKKIPIFLNADGGFINHHPIKDLVKKFIVKNCDMYFSSGSAADAFFYEYGGTETKIRHHHFTSLTNQDIMSSPSGTQEKTELKKILGLDTNFNYVISVGQFIHRKGFDLLLNAWEPVSEHKNWKLLIIGGGELESDLKEQILKSKNKDSVILMNFMEKSELIKYYKASDLFCLLTREDVWGLVVNEAMAVGLPVITTRQCVAGNELITDGENGYIVDCDDTAAATSAITHLIEYEELRTKMAKNNVAKMQGQTIENIGKSHIKEIETFFNE